MLQHGAATWRLMINQYEIVRMPWNGLLSFLLTGTHRVETRHHSQNPSTQHTALSLDEDRATATGNMYRKTLEVWARGF